jgi:hypothetical protein
MSTKTAVQSDEFIKTIESFSSVNSGNLREIIKCIAEEDDNKDPECANLLTKDETKAFFAEIKKYSIIGSNDEAAYFFAQTGSLPSYQSQEWVARHSNPITHSLGECRWKISPNDYTDQACITKVNNAKQQLKQLKDVKALSDKYDKWIELVNSGFEEEEDTLISDVDASGVATIEHAVEG